MREREQRKGRRREDREIHINRSHITSISALLLTPITFLESVRGFRLVSLERLSQLSSTRKLNGVSSLMHFLVLTLSNAQPQLLTFADELQHVDHAAKSIERREEKNFEEEQRKRKRRKVEKKEAILSQNLRS